MTTATARAVAAVATEIREGTALGAGRYELERLLGAGGMATVWLARDERLEREVAIKLLSDALAADESYTQRFEREARLAARIAHPNLVAIYDFGNEGRPYLVMEYVSGASLSELLRADADRDRVDPADLARSLLEALACIHRAGVVHRDVKPSNLLLGDDGRIRLTDFGIAVPEDGARLTMTGNVMGTLRYLAPEVKAGHSSTPASDLYAAGMVLGEALGDRPDAELRELVRSLCEPDPAERPASAAEALDGLRSTRAPGAPRAPLPAHARAPRADAPDARTTPIRAPAPDRAPPDRAWPDRAWPAAARRSPVGGQRSRGRGLAPALLAVAVAVVAAVLLAGGGNGTTRSQAGRGALPRADAPLPAQLDALQRAVGGLGH